MTVPGSIRSAVRPDSDNFIRVRRFACDLNSRGLSYAALFFATPPN